MTRIEVLLGLFVVVTLAGILFAPFLPAIGRGLTKGPMTQTLSNLRQLQTATQIMTLDNESTGSSLVNWTCTGATPLTFAQWSNAIVPTYLSEADFRKLLSYTEARRFWPDLHLTNVVNVYAVTGADSPSTLLFATRNWRGPTATNLDDSQYGKEGFVVFHKGGDGSILKRTQLTSTNVIGSGGLHNYQSLR